MWWQRSIIYQVYPRSFQDSNGSGVGDLPGITARLDHLRWLGVNAVWISPIYPSPMADFGYDVSDYTGIHPLFGTMEDFDRLLREAGTPHGGAPILRGRYTRRLRPPGISATIVAQCYTRSTAGGVAGRGPNQSGERW